MKQIKQFLERFGMHSFLLPVFFAIHNYIQYHGLVSGKVVIITLVELELIFLLFSVLLFAIIKNLNKSFQITTLLGFVFLFYGVIKDFLHTDLGIPFIAKYIVLLPLVTIICILLIRIILKKKDFKKPNLFQNVLLILYILVDSSLLIFSENTIFTKENLLVKNDRLDLNKLTVPASRPDVYYIVLDSYPGTIFLKEYMDYDNTPFNDSLQNRGFHVIGRPKSNYNRTAFSLASTLNFEYLQNIFDSTPIKSKDYNQAKLTIQLSTVPRAFERWGYSMYNLSVFDIGERPAMYKETFLNLPEKQVLLYNTLPQRIRTDILWNLITSRFAGGFIRKHMESTQNEIISNRVAQRDFNNRIVDSIQKIPSQKSDNPKFVYAHLYLPHPPFFYDKNGKENELELVITEESLKNKSLFLSYLEYTNQVVLKVVDKILSNPGKPSIIVIQSDHGFRDFDSGPTLAPLYFKNYFAVYLPDKNYTGIYDTLSNVNTFPLIFNKYFNTKIPLQPDTSIFLAY